jgi:sucrose phosphorylase
MNNQIQLITYPDSLGGNLKELKIFLDTYLKGVIGGIHILPFYPSSADRGFAPLTHLEVDPSFGDWGDIKAISAQFDLMVDVTVNHVSSASHYFKDYLEKNQSSEYRDMFLDEEWFFNKYGVGPESLEQIYRPRPTRPFTRYAFADGTTKEIWTTFTHEQIDLDVESTTTRAVIKEAVEWLAAHGANLIRLDAAGYCVKRPFTNCFLLPETYAYMRWVRENTPTDVGLLAEIHFDPDTQFEILESETVEWVYDFSLPFLTLSALRTGNNTYLRGWLEKRSHNMVSTLDTHDGIGVVDVKGLLPESEIDNTIAWVEERGANQSLRASGADVENLDIYQINCTYYSAVGEDDDAYIVARAMQLFIPGIAQIYYVGLLAGKNDYETLSKTLHGRDVNRHNYTWPEMTEAMEQSVVKRLLMLMKLRTNHLAFAGEYSLSTPSDTVLVFTWRSHQHYCQASIDVQKKTVALEYTDSETHTVQKLFA